MEVNLPAKVGRRKKKAHLEQWLTNTSRGRKYLRGRRRFLQTTAAVGVMTGSAAVWLPWSGVRFRSALDSRAAERLVLTAMLK
jgi:hypothetical protein